MTSVSEKWLSYAVLLGTLSILAGCANLNTIDRETDLDSLDDKGKVIHLDIQQRLVVVNAMGKYCAEPSPDALAAFAAAVGIGASAPAKGAVSAAGGASSSAASVGLRTQSITLMRDALYRMCEAYGNGQLSKPQVMALLSRSQDLTAVILATEQLTGAVVAQQAALSGSASSDATAVMTATAELLEVALKQQERAQGRLEKALAAKSDAEAKQKDAETERASAQVERDNNPGNDAAGQRSQARVERAQRNLDAAIRKVTLAEEVRALREKTLEAASERVETLQAAQDSAATTAAASSSTNAVLAGGGERSRLSDQSTQAISTAVASMVNNVLNKNYVLDYCMAIISADTPSSSQKADQEDRKLCRSVVLRSMDAEEYRVVGVTDSFKKTADTECIKTWLDADPENKVKLDKWRENNAIGVSHVILLYGKTAVDLRAAAVNDLSIPCP